MRVLKAQKKVITFGTEGAHLQSAHACWPGRDSIHPWPGARLSAELKEQRVRVRIHAAATESDLIYRPTLFHCDPWAGFSRQSFGESRACQKKMLRRVTSADLGSDSIFETYSSRSLISHLRKLIPEVRNSESGAESAVVAAVPEGEITIASCKQKSGRICAHRQNHERRPVLELFGARAASQNCNSHSRCFCHFSEVEGHAACAC